MFPKVIFSELVRVLLSSLIDHGPALQCSLNKH